MLEALGKRLDLAGGAPQPEAAEPDTQAPKRRDWLAPLGLALGVRIALFVLGDVGLRMLNPAGFTGSIAIWNEFDVGWYTQLAMYGYDIPGKNTANFFPLYPMLMSPLGHLFDALGVHNAYVVSGMLISWAAFLAACVFLYWLVAGRFGSSVALSSVLLLSVFPFSFFYGIAYTESVFLLTAVLAFYGVERKQWWLASVAACFAGAVRPPGLFVGAAVALAYALDWLQTRHGWRWDVLWLALAPVGTLAYLLFCWILFGDPLAYQEASIKGWHGGQLQWKGIQSALHLLLHPGSWVFIRTNTDNILFGFYAVLLVVFLVSLIWVFRLLGPHYAFFTFACSVSSVATFPTLSSLGRYLSVVFPAFIVAAYYLRKRPVLQQVLVIASSLLLAAFTFAFFYHHVH